MSILKKLYYGKIRPQETAIAHSPEQKELDRKIESEKRYFVEKMSLDDNQRFEQLERLYMQAAESEKIALFSEGFQMGTRLMLEILSGQAGITDDWKIGMGGFMYYELNQIINATPEQQLKFQKLMTELDREASEREPYNRRYRRELRRYNDFRAETGDKHKH